MPCSMNNRRWLQRQSVAGQGAHLKCSKSILSNTKHQEGGSRRANLVTREKRTLGLFQTGQFTTLPVFFAGLPYTKTGATSKQVFATPSPVLLPPIHSTDKNLFGPPKVGSLVGAQQQAATFCGTSQPFCGWTKSCTTLKPWETTVCWYLQGIRPFQGFLGGAKWIWSIHSTTPNPSRPCCRCGPMPDTCFSVMPPRPKIWRKRS